MKFVGLRNVIQSLSKDLYFLMRIQFLRSIILFLTSSGAITSF